jgi:hypothetical protein
MMHIMYSKQNPPPGFYVYSYRNEDGTPYYFGKGFGSRAWNVHQNGIAIPNSDLIVIHHCNISELWALLLERKYIRWYGRLDKNTGILENKTDGGDGVSGAIRSDETKNLQSQKAIARWQKEDQVEQITQIRRAYYASEDGANTKNKIADVVTALWEDDEYRARQQASRDDPAYRMILKEKAKNREMFQCPHCLRFFQKGHLSRFHGDKCKLKIPK